MIIGGHNRNAGAHGVDHGMGEVSTMAKLLCPVFGGSSLLSDTCREYYADLYSQVQYGTIPAPSGSPQIEAPQTQVQMTTPGAWTPDLASGDIAAWNARNQAMIAEAERAGTYTPQGKLPWTATQAANAFGGVMDWLPWVAGGIGVIAVLVLIKR